MWLKKLNSAFQKQKNVEILSTGNSCRVGDYFSHRAKKVWVGKNVFMFWGSENVSEFVTLEKIEMAF